MRAIRAASVALLSAAAVVTVAPTALAGEDDNNGITSFGFSVAPATIAPGGTVTLKSDGCEVPSVTVTSGVFDTITLSEGRTGTATVDLDAKAGAQYEITFDCKGERGTTTLTIAQGDTGGNAGGTTGGHDDGTAPGAHKGVKAGYGTAAASGADTEGLGVTEVVTGVLLIAGALGAAIVLTRRRTAEGRV
ncbi:hypothetical protein ACH4M4_27505 [Streptomyces sp. NPDC017254]|uniref:hypothetical protein n=1 Tax=unclassified Streptomyces TaxID=2593676 RepID=UPI0037AD59C6